MDHQSFTVGYFRSRDLLAQDQLDEFDKRARLRMFNPNIVFGFSLFLGFLGVDRFVIGDWGKGLLKLLTLGGFLIWAIVDLFLVSGRARDKNSVIIDSIVSELNQGGEHEPH